MSLKSMYSLDITLKEFVSQIPSCLQEDSLEKILDAAQSGHSETIAILNSQQSPLGIVKCHSLLSLLTKYCHNRVTASISYDRPSDRETVSPPVKELKALIQPVTTLSSQTTIREFIPYFKKAPPSSHKNHTYLIINSQGQLLGLLDTAKLLKHLLFSSQTEVQTPLIPLSIDRHVVSFLEAIALPLKLQTANGRILYQNSCWRKSIGETLLDSKPIAQWWLKQQETSKVTESVDSSQSESHYHCLKGNYHLTPSFNLASSPEVDSQLTRNWNYSHYLSTHRDDSDRQEPNLDSIQPFPTAESNHWHDLQIPLNFAPNTSLETNSSRGVQGEGGVSPSPSHWLVLTIPSSETQLDFHNSKDAELIELNRLKDELLANISHELKSPLTGIVGLSSLLKEEKLGELNQRQLRYAKLIYHSGRKLIAIVSDLLDLTSLATGKLKLNLELIELRSLCQEVYQQVLTKLEALAPANPETLYLNRTFELTIEPGLEIALADRLRLRQILSHLLTNSLKFTRPHGKVGIKINSCANWIAITVWDDGMGIPELKQRLLLQPLLDEVPADYSLQGLNTLESEDSPYPQQQKAGLGTIIAQQLAKAHGGDISFISRVGKGSEFTLLLPSQPVRSDRPLNLDNVASDEKTNSLVLVVETKSSQIENATSWLRDLGYYPIVARTGTEALQKARQLKPSYILLNPTLPLLSGKYVLKLLKSDPRTSNISLFVMTTQENVASDRNLYQQADGFIDTPLNKIDLASILPAVNKQAVNQIRNLTKSEKLCSQTAKALTILCLYPEPEFTHESTVNNISNSSFNLKDWAERDWTNHHNEIDSTENYHHRIIEADGLEQAHMLAKIWQLDTIVLDGSGLKEPLNYLRSLQESEELAALPLVTLDAATTEAANKIKGLAVYPCLVPAESRSTIDLMQVIQIAANN